MNDIELQRRLYYQTIVYKVCSLLDKYNNDKMVVAGTLEKPSNDVIETLQRILKNVNPT